MMMSTRRSRDYLEVKSKLLEAVEFGRIYYEVIEMHQQVLHFIIIRNMIVA